MLEYIRILVTYSITVLLCDSCRLLKTFRITSVDLNGAEVKIKGYLRQWGKGVATEQNHQYQHMPGK